MPVMLYPAQNISFAFEMLLFAIPLVF